MFHFHPGLEAPGAVQVTGGQGPEKRDGFKGYVHRQKNPQDLRIPGAGAARRGKRWALRFLDSTANRWNDAHH